LWTTSPVDALTTTCRPLGETAMWSERSPWTSKRHLIRPVRRLIPTTSANDGRDTTTRRPSLEEYMSSTNWSWPSPIIARIARKNASRRGFVAISIIRSL
jgi:hypothetical protein